MTPIFEELCKLYENELYSNAKTLSQLILSLYSQNRTVLSSGEYFSVNVVYSICLKEEKLYNEAAEAYNKTIIIRKQLPKNLPNDLCETFIEKYSEPELKYQMARCLVECKQTNEAIQTLQSVSNKQRTPKINMLLGKLMHESGKSSTMFYKEVLKECPLAFEAIEGLISLKVKGSEVNSLVLAVSQSCGDWLNNWIKALSQIKERKFDDAIQTLKTIEYTTYLKNYPLLLVLIGECYYAKGHYEMSYNYLKRAYKLYPQMKRGIQKYAMLLFQMNKESELEQIIRPSSTLAYEHSSEMWFVLAQYLLAVQRPEKAIYIIEKAILMDKNNVDAVLLKSRIYHQMKKSTEALTCLRTALKMDPFRYETHKGIIEVCMSVNKFKEAQQQANTLKQIGENSPRILTLAATTYLKDPALVGRAKNLLIKAMDMNDIYVKGCLLLARIYVDEKDVNSAIKLLEKVSNYVVNIKVYLMLGELYAQKKNQSAAMEQYTKVLNIDPNNRQALNGLMVLGTSSNSNANSSTAVLDVSSTSEEISDLQESALAVNESPVIKATPDSGESESELAWSDIDMDIHNPPT